MYHTNKDRAVEAFACRAGWAVERTGRHTFRVRHESQRRWTVIGPSKYGTYAPLYSMATIQMILAQAETAQ